MNYQEIAYDMSDRVATITLNRPDRLNALTLRTTAELREAVLAAEADTEVRVIVITGAGRGFSAGADISSLGELAGGKSHRLAEEAEDYGRSASERDLAAREGTREDFRREHSFLPGISKPVVAGVNGAAAGLGMVIALYADMRIASERARFTTAFAQRGLIAEYGIAWILPRLVGLGQAIDLTFSGRIVGAEEALRMGLVSRVVPHEGFAAELHGIAADLALRSSPRSLRVMKRQLYDAQFESLAESYDTAVAEMLESFGSEDFGEGVAHWQEKRDPVFSGK